ncbi:MAG: sensor histidine kinase [Chloroflexota bacterium]
MALVETLASQAAIAVANAVLLDRLREKVAEMELLRDRLLHVQEEERKTLAQSIHDDILGVFLHMLNSMESAAHAVPEGSVAATHVRRAMELGDYAAHRLRETAADLYPTELTYYGLVAALSTATDEINRNETFEVTFVHRTFPDDYRLSPKIEEALYRVARQALDNVSRHAHASSVDIDLALTHGSVALSVRDNGRGFTRAASSMALLRAGHLGLVTMCERIEGLGGGLSIESELGGGTHLRACLPSPPSQLPETRRSVRAEM